MSIQRLAIRGHMSVIKLKQSALFCVVFAIGMMSLPAASVQALENGNASKASFVVTDLAGRDVQVPNQVNRIILGESRYIPALAILDQEQPLKRIVGMLADFKQTDPGSYHQYASNFPEIERIPQVGHASADSFSVERVLTLKADVAIFGLAGHGPTHRNAELIEQLERAGVAVIFLDFRQKPLINTVKSIELLGKVLNREPQAQAFAGFYTEQLARVTTKLAQLENDDALNAPSVFLHSRVGLQDLCCETMVRGMMASFVDASKGKNVAKTLVPGAAGVMNLEYLLSMQPDIYIATAIGSLRDEPEESADPNQPLYIVLGAGVSESVARQSFRQAINDSGVMELTAVKSKRAFAVWHHFYNTPLNVVAVQAIAKWMYPEAFADLEPKQTMQTLFDRFQPVPLNGTYWVSL